MTLLDLYNLIEKIQNKIDGNCHVSVSIPHEKMLEIRLHWTIENVPVFFVRCYSLEELQAGMFDLVDTFTMLANYAYTKKKKEMTK